MISPPRPLIQRRPRILRSRWLPWSVAACIAAACAWLGLQRYHLQLYVDSCILRDQSQQHALDDTHGRLLALQRQLSRVEDTLAASAAETTGLRIQLDASRREIARRDEEASQLRVVTLVAAKDTPQPLAVVAWDTRAQRGILQPGNLPELDAGHDYQLWITDPPSGTPVNAGVFDPARPWQFQPVSQISSSANFTVTVEPKGGSPAPTGPIVLGEAPAPGP